MSDKKKKENPCELCYAKQGNHLISQKDKTCKYWHTDIYNKTSRAILEHDGFRCKK